MEKENPKGTDVEKESDVWGQRKFLQKYSSRRKQEAWEFLAIMTAWSREQV